MDRPIRPLWPDGFRDEVQVQAFVMASDRQNDGDVLGMIGASAALRLSPLPFQGPIGSVRLGCIDGEFVPFPTHDALEESDLDLIVSGSKDSILMIEGFAREMPEDRMVEAIVAAHGYIRQICEMQEELAAKAGTVKKPFEAPPADTLGDVLRTKYYDAFRAAKQTTGKLARGEACAALKNQALAEMIPDPKAEGAITAEAFASAWEALETRVMRDQILTGIRADGRDHKTLRPITCKVDLLPRVHGSAMFQRGETQAMVTVTLGTGRDEQRVDGLVEEYSQKFMLHYYFPSFSVGECPPDPRSGPAGDRPRGAGRAERQAGPARPRRLPLHDPHHLRHLGEQRFEFDGQRLRGDVGADGRRRADQQSRGRHLRRPGERARPLRPADRHHRRRGPLRRHGLQSGRHAERHHRHPVGPEDRRHQRADHPRDAQAVARGADRNPPLHAQRDSRVRGPRFRAGRRGCCGRTSTPRRSAC